jgi:hypothetical protein
MRGGVEKKTTYMQFRERDRRRSDALLCVASPTALPVWSASYAVNDTLNLRSLPRARLLLHISCVARHISIRYRIFGIASRATRP